VGDTQAETDVAIAPDAGMQVRRVRKGRCAGRAARWGAGPAGVGVQEYGKREAHDNSGGLQMGARARTLV